MMFFFANPEATWLDVSFSVNAKCQAIIGSETVLQFSKDLSN